MAPKSPQNQAEEKSRRSSAGNGGRSRPQKSARSSAGPSGVQKASKNKVPVTRTAKGHFRKSPPQTTGSAVVQSANAQDRGETGNANEVSSTQTHHGEPLPEPSQANDDSIAEDSGLRDLRMRNAPDADEIFREIKEYSGITFKDDKNAKLRLILRILHDLDSGDTTRLFYQLSIYLSHKAEGTDVEHDEIGHFECYRLSKPTAKHANVEPLWIKEYLRLDLKKMDTDSDLVSGIRQEIAKAMQALYSPKSALPRRKFRKSIAQALQENSIFYIAVVYIRELYTGNKLLPQIMTRFCCMLGTLPEWFAFSGNVILTPGWLHGARGQQWTRKYRRPVDADKVALRLEGVYKKVAFETWVDSTNVERSGNFVTVMCRSIPGEGDTIMAAADDGDDDGNDWYYDFPGNGEKTGEKPGDGPGEDGQDNDDGDHQGAGQEDDASDDIQAGADDIDEANDDDDDDDADDDDDDDDDLSSLSAFPEGESETEYQPDASRGSSRRGTRAGLQIPQTRAQTRSQTQAYRWAGAVGMGMMRKECTHVRRGAARGKLALLRRSASRFEFFGQEPWTAIWAQLTNDICEQDFTCVASRSAVGVHSINHVTPQTALRL